VCDRVAVLRRGELALLTRVGEIRKLAPRRVQVMFAEDVGSVPDLPPPHEMVRSEARAWTLRVHGELGPLLKILSHLPVSDLEIDEPRLEDVILGYYREAKQ